MRKKMTIVFRLCSVLLIGMFISSCVSDTHEHSFSKEYSKNEKYHWHKCEGCKETSDKEEHSWDNGVVTKEATDTTKGEKTYTCIVCKETKVEKVVVSKGLEFTLSDTKDSYIVTGVGACEDTNIVIPAIYKGLPVKSIGRSAFKGRSNLTSITMPNSVTSIGDSAFSNCSNLTNIVIPKGVTSIGEGAFEGCNNLTIYCEAHIWNDGVVTIEPTETKEGEITYTCTVCEATKVEKIDKHPHQHKYLETYITDENYHWYKCEECEEIIDKKVHIWNDGVITKEATETTEGEKTYTCTVCGKTKVEKIDKLPHQHKYLETYITDENYHWNKCEECEEITNREAHIWNDGVVTKEATETTEGEITYICTVCGKTKVEKIDKLPHQHKYPETYITDENYHWYKCEECEEITNREAHTWNDGVVTIEPTETTEGETTYTCTVCGKTKVEKIDKLPHQHKYPETYITDENYHWYKCEECEEITNKEAHIWNDGVVTIEPTETIEGETTYTCTVCGKTKVEKIDKIEQDNNLKFELSDTEDSYVVTGLGSCEDTDIVIPAVYKGLPVTTIGESAFNGCSTLASIVIPETVTSIEGFAFFGCINLIDITIPNSVTSIENTAFSWCSSLTSIVIPENLTTIRNQTFQACNNLTSIVIPNTVTSIGSQAFEDCSSLTSIVIPNSVTTIGKGAFSGCSNLTSITIPFVGETLNETSNNYFGYIFSSPFDDSFGNNSVPSSLTEVIVTGGSSIGNLAFEGCSNLTSIDIPNSVTNIEWRAFSGCSSLTSIVISEGVTSIASEAFNDCVNLSSIEISNSVTSIGFSAFSGCSKLQYNEYGNCKYLGNKENSYLALIEVNDTSIEEVSINKNTKLICSSAFNGCSNLTSIEIPNNVTNIGSSTFAYCSSLTSIVIPNSVTSIGSSTFAYCSSLTNIIIPEGVTSIEDSTFSGCSSLTSIVIPNSVRSIGNWAFARCSSLTNIVIPESLTTIGACAFYECSNLTNIIIPEGVTSIEDSTFSGCSGLTSIEIPNIVTSIRECAFYGCSGLTSVVIPGSVTSIGKAAFGGCINLTSIVILEGLTSIGASPFSGCTNLISIDIPNSITYIESYSFSDCSKLQYNKYGNCKYLGNKDNPYLALIEATDKSIEEAIINENTKLICESAFYNCNNLTSIEIPHSVTNIGRNAFMMCINLSRIEIPNTVTSIGWDAFYGCNMLTFYCEADSEPEEWGSYWNPYNMPVIWGYEVEEHNWDNGVVTKEATETTEGEKVYTCTICGKTKTIKIDIIPHQHKYLETYITDEIYHWHQCEGCEKTTSKEVHSWDNGVVIKEATQTAKGEKKYTCTICGKTKIKVINNIVESIGLEFELFYTEDCYVVIGVGTCKDKDIIIPSTYEGLPVTSIGDFAFSNCSSLTSIVISESVTSIGNAAFSSCRNLTSIEMPNSVTLIGDSAFEYCNNLTSIEISNGVTWIGTGTFRGCSRLTSVFIPNSITSIYPSAFENCSNLTSIVIPESVTSIGWYAFSGCSSLTSIVIPKSVTIIEDCAFSGYDDMIIYCEASSQPSGWSEFWKPSEAQVYWSDEW